MYIQPVEPLNVGMNVLSLVKKQDIFEDRAEQWVDLTDHLMANLFQVKPETWGAKSAEGVAELI